MGVDSIAVATVGLGGHVYNRLRVARPRGRFSPEETTQDVAKLAGPLLDSLPSDRELVGVGAAIVGITRRSDGFVHLAPNLGWRDVPIAAMLAAELDLGVPVLAANDADLGALAEHRRGVRPGIGNLIFVSGEVGIGAGVIVGGKPLLGSAGYAGEAGHTLINPNGHGCRCGASGCWETEAGEAALLRLTGMQDRMGHIDDVAELAAAGDERTLRAIAEVGRWLGLGIGDLINLFNPDLVVLGGLYQRLYTFLEASVIEGARQRTLDAPGAMATIACSGLGADAPLIGAAEQVLSEVIADPAGTNGRRARRRIAAGGARA
jgi:predicted NBD/HSP70 family sugar kinase